MPLKRNPAGTVFSTEEYFPLQVDKGVPHQIHDFSTELSDMSEKLWRAPVHARVA